MKNQLNRLSEYVARWLSSAFKQQYQNDQYQSSQPLSSPQKLGSDLDHQRQAELQFRSALDNAPTLIWMSDPEAQCTYFNQTWLTFTGRSLKQELGTGWLAGVHPDDYQQCIDTYLSAFEARQPFTIEHRLRRASGEYRWVLNNGAPHCLENHEFIGYIGSCVDITDLKQATLQTASHAGSHMLYDSTHPDGSIHSSLSQGEPVLAAHGQVSQQGETRQDITTTKLTETSLSEWEEQNQAILSAIPDILAVISSEGIYLNYSYNQFSGQLIQPETIDPTGLHVSEVLPPEVASMCLAAVRQALETGEIQIYEQPVQCGDIIQSEETRVVPYQADKVLCIVRNISDRQQIENSLHPSKARQHALVQALPDLIMRLSRDGIYLDFFSNSDFQGIEAQDTLFDTHASLPPDLAQRRCNAIQTALETGELQIYEHEIWLDGTLRIEECRVIPCHDDQVLVIGRDITDRKRSTAQLAIQNELLARIARGEPLANILDTLVQKIEQNLPGALCSIMLLDDMNCLQLHAGQSLPQTYTQRLYNLPIGEGRGSCGTAAFRQQTVITADIATDPLWAAYRQKPLEHGLKACWSTPIVTADDRVLGVFGVYYQTVRSPLPDELEILGQIANIAGIAIEREQAEARIRQSEEQLRLTLEFTGIGSWSWQPTTGQYTWNGQMEQLLELPPGLDNLFQVWSERLHPDDRDRVTTKIQTALATQTAFSDEYRYQLQDGRFVWRWVMGQGIYTATGEVKRALGIVQDITDRKRTEIALRTAEERYSLATRAARVGVWEWHLTTNQIYIDPNVKALAGYTNEEFPSDIEHWLQIAHPEDRDRIMSVVKDYLTGKIPELAFEHRIVHKNGSMIWVLVRGELLCDEQGNPKCLIGTNTDISELKQAELALRRSEATKNAIIQAIPDLLVRMDRDGHHQELICNEYLQVLRPDSPIHAATVRDILPFNQTEQRLQYTNLALDTGQLQVYEQALELDGQLRHEEVRIIPLLNQEVLVIVRDITDRKQAEFALREKQQQLKSLLNNIPHIAWLKDRDGRFLAVNEPFAQACGFPLAQLIGLTDLDIWPQHLAEAYIQDDREVMASGQQKRVEEPLLTPEGLEKWIETIKTPILNEYGESIGTAGIAMDITERRRAEVAMQQLNEELERRIQRRTQELARSEQDLRTIFNNVYDAILIHDMDGNILDCNDRSLELFAVTREQLLAANVANLAVEAAQPESISATMQRVEAGETLRFEWQARRFSDGTVLEVEVSLQKVTLANRAVTIAGVRDIRDRKQAERDLQESRNMFKLVLDTIPQRVFWKDRQSRFLGCNPAFANDYHLGNEEIIGKTDLELPWALWADLYRGDDARVMDTNCPKLDYEEPTINLDGEQIWIRSSKIPLTNTQGEVIGVLGCYDDITDRKQTEQALRDSEERLRLALTATAQGLYDLDLQTGKAIVSPEYASMLGYDPATFEETNTKWIERLHPDDVEAVTLAYRAYVAGEIPDYNIEFRQRTQDGKWKWILSLGRIVAWNESGHPLRMLGTHTDIDDRKQAEAALQQLNLELEQRVSDRTLELQKAMEAAEAANRAKSTFLANMSHELRTPLNAILGFAQLMSRKLTLEPEQRNQLSIINRSGNHLLNLINDILEMSKIEAGRSTFVKNRFDFYSMLDSLEEMFHFRAIEKGLQLIINRGSALPRYIETDENKLRQVLINLIGNAVKFTLAGRVMLRVTANLSAEEGTQAEPSREQSITLCFEVTDTGIGISPDEIDSLFEPFIQSRSPQLSQEGTGLGLSISQQFVQLMGGELTVNSVLGVGSTFSFSIPVKVTEIESLTTRSQSQHILQLAPDQPVYRILVAEDNDTNRQLLVQLLQAVGFIVQSAINGQEAIAQWESWQPHLIWMDMRMPVMNGYEATQQIRAKEQERNYQSRHADPSADLAAVPSAQAPTFIIALTANAFEEERARVLEAGCNDFIRKPFQETELLEKMAAYLGVEYLYVSPHQAEATAIAPSDGMNEIAALRSLPSSLLAQMLQATMQIDYQRLTTLLEEVASTQPDVAALLTKKLDDFDFEGILQLLEKANPTLP